MLSKCIREALYTQRDARTKRHPDTNSMYQLKVRIGPKIFREKRPAEFMLLHPRFWSMISFTSSVKDWETLLSVQDSVTLFWGGYTDTLIQRKKNLHPCPKWPTNLPKTS